MKRFLAASAALMLSASVAQAFDEKLNLETPQWIRVYNDATGHTAAIDVNNLLRDDKTGDVMGWVCLLVGRGMTCHLRPELVKFTCDGTHLYSLVRVNSTMSADPGSQMSTVSKIACRGRI